jgi:hypothetical protein
MVCPLQKLAIKDHKYTKDKKKATLTLYWDTDEQHTTVVEQHITVFTPVICRLVPTDEPLKWNVS